MPISETLFTLIKDCLIRFALPIGKCRGQAYDGASNMSGHLVGVSARVQQCEETAVFVHCLAHCKTHCSGSLSLPLYAALSNATCCSSKKAESHQILFQSTGAYALVSYILLEAILA